MDSLEFLFREALSTGDAAIAAQARYLDALRSHDREERAAAREALRISREVAHAALAAYYAARAERGVVRIVCSNTFTVDHSLLES